jgi:hypothetical protein
MRGWASCVVCAAIGCGGGKSATPDAAKVIDAAATADSGAPDAAAPMFDAMPSAVHTYYLNFEGQALTAGGTDDPATNTTSIITASYTMPAYLAADAARTTKIAAIVSEVQTILAPYDITVTTTRPASGAYDMMAAGGTAQAAGLAAGVQSITSFDCMAAHQHVMLLFDQGETQDDAAHQIVAMLGIAQTVPQSTKSLDCMCYANPTGCGVLTGPCTIAGAGTPVYSAQACDTKQTTMDENGEWLAVFGAHP